MREIIGDSGPAVLLLPGGAESVDGFFPGMVDALVADPGCRVILYDRPGVAGSEVDGDLAGATAALHEAITAFGVGPVVVIGQSLGAAVAVLLAADHPADVAGLVLLDPTPLNDPALARMVEKRARSAVRAAGLPGIGALLRAMLRSSTRKSARRHDMSPQAKAAAAAMAELDFVQLGRAVEGLGDIADDFDHANLPSVPSIVVTADRTRGRTNDRIRAAHERLATALGAQLVSWPHAEHAVHLSHESEVIDVSRAVVRQVAASHPAA